MSQTDDSPFDELPLRIGLGQFREPTDDRLRFIKQLGVDDVLLNMYRYSPDYPHLPNEDRPLLATPEEWTVDALVELRERIERAGLRLNAIENVPIAFYDHVMLGGDRRDEQLDDLRRIVRNLGEAGIPMFGYHWMPSGVWRNTEVAVRGDARASGFDLDAADDSLTHEREYTEAELWENYERFLRAVLPVAEEVGVKLCLHPNDPPVDSLGGVPQLFRNFENFQRAMDLVPSDNHGLEFCLGCWSEMGEDLEAAIRYFGSRGKLYYVHFRDVEGTVPRFNETFLDQGNYDSARIFGLLDEVGFRGMIIPDHVPHVEGDSTWDHRGRAHAVGYLQGLLAMHRACAET
ncbi:mannonate dehydratase [Halogeometricum luteum]|uniref:mannonate dehydratase n=1 Tax=Halogeometricum luteum TaxID=2950537 RepID=A0ABU2G2F6_9EURY|nr:mannonate dehydratase [Halogeometricum sp. S3BR5-2]MDS0294971.1 mannonate dehydratase [Halogeometricum sp. S3BR5-2]